MFRAFLEKFPEIFEGCAFFLELKQFLRAFWVCRGSAELVPKPAWSVVIGSPVLEHTRTAQGCPEPLSLPNLWLIPPHTAIIILSHVFFSGGGCQPLINVCVTLVLAWIALIYLLLAQTVLLPYLLAWFLPFFLYSLPGYLSSILDNNKVLRAVLTFFFLFSSTEHKATFFPVLRGTYFWNLVPSLSKCALTVSELAENWMQTDSAMQSPHVFWELQPQGSWAGGTQRGWAFISSK